MYHGIKFNGNPVFSPAEDIIMGSHEQLIIHMGRYSDDNNGVAMIILGKYSDWR